MHAGHQLQLSTLRYEIQMASLIMVPSGGSMNQPSCGISKGDCHMIVIAVHLIALDSDSS